jgi:hypothetical protein
MPVTPGGPEDRDAMSAAVALTRALLDSDGEARYAIMSGTADMALLAFHAAGLASAILCDAVSGDHAAARAVLARIARRMLAAEASQDGQP